MATITVSEYKALMSEKKLRGKFANVKRGEIVLWNGVENYKLKYRSGYECTFGLFMQNLVRQNTAIVKWLYESLELRFDGCRRGALLWIPDFVAYDRKNNVIQIFEVKGLMTSKDSGKIRKLKKYHPEMFGKLVYVTGRKNFPKLIKLGVLGMIDIETVKRNFGGSK